LHTFATESSLTHALHVDNIPAADAVQIIYGLTKKILNTSMKEKSQSPWKAGALGETNCK
jgi:hypothetical protein